jgi:GST-like protein
MIDLYGMTSPNVVKIVLALEELKLPYRFKFIDVFMGEQFTPDFGTLTPNRKVPVIVDSDGPGGAPFTLWESGAILLYLAEKTGELMPSDARQRYVAMQWLMFQMSGIGPMFGQHSHFKVFHKDHGSHYSRARYGTEVKRLYDVLEARLKESPFLAGPQYSIVDIAAWPWVRSMQVRGVEASNLPSVANWVNTIGTREAAVRTLAVIKTMHAPNIDKFAVEHPDQLDRYLGRGNYSRVSADE